MADLDKRLLIVLAAAALPLVPLPRGLAHLISPATEAAVDAISLVPTSGPLPLTIAVKDTAHGVLLYAAVLLVFFSARQIFAARGLRTVTRAVALIGLVLAVVAIAQHVTNPRLMYWRWLPIDEAAYPFGPFVNRNHFGTWAILAVPLCAGYLLAHATAHHGPRADMPWQRRVKATLDARGALLLATCTSLVLATVISLSRSGMIGLLATAVAGAAIGRWKVSAGAALPRRALLFAGAAGFLSLVAVLFVADPAALRNRFSATGVAAVDRLLIWRDTMSVVRDFWLTGSGVGTYQISMALYQQSSPGVIYNQAHNHYLQVVAEGGLLVSIPAAFALASFVRLAKARLAEDKSGLFWVRAGAASALCGIAVQNLWETGLTTPANAALAAVVAAAVVTDAHGRSGSSRMR